MNQWLPSLRETVGETTVQLRLDPTIWAELPAGSAGRADCGLSRRFVDDGASGECTLAVGLLPAFGRRLERLYLLTRADTTGADELAIEHRPDTGLGRSVRVLRHDRADPDRPGLPGTCAVRQAWRLNPGTDLLVSLVAPRAQLLYPLLGSLDAAVRSLRVEVASPAAGGDVAFAPAAGTARLLHGLAS